MSDIPAVELLATDKTYPNGAQALLPLSLSVQQGELITLLGPSGCGKGTLLRMIAGLLEPSHGRLLLWGQPVGQIESGGHRLSFVFQEPTLMPWATVLTVVFVTHSILQSGYQLNIPRMFAALLLIAAAGVLLFAATTWLSRRALGGWHESEAERS